MTADNITIEVDEDGFHMRIETTEDSSVLDFWLADPEQLHKEVLREILPWLVERDEARAAWHLREKV